MSCFEYYSAVNDRPYFPVTKIIGHLRHCIQIYLLIHLLRDLRQHNDVILYAEVNVLATALVLIYFFFFENRPQSCPLCSH